MKNIVEARPVAVSEIRVPEKYHRSGDAVEDDKLLQSIKRTGVQQPLVVTQVGEKAFVLIDGFRRLQVAKYLGLNEVPCVIDEVPDGDAADEYRDRIRFILDEHRQDLFPSQRATLIETLMANFGMNRKQVAEYLGVDAATIGNWLDVSTFIPEVVSAIDSEEITQHAARVFVGMKKEGQEEVWKTHKKELQSLPGGKVHRLIREKYHPREFPQFYERPEKVVQKLNRVKAKRTSAVRPRISKTAADLLAKDLELREAELRDAERELERVKHEIGMATKLIRVIMQNDALLQLVPDDIRADFDRFAEIYV